MARIITLVGERFAKEGATFEYGGIAPACAPCRLKQVCHAFALRPHHEYRISRVREVHHDCPAGFFDGGMRVAEVEPMPVTGTIPASAMRGTGWTHRFEECGAACRFRRFCDTPAIPQGEGCRILEVGEAVDCKVGRDLRFAKLQPLIGE